MSRVESKSNLLPYIFTGDVTELKLSEPKVSFINENLYGKNEVRLKEFIHGGVSLECRGVKLSLRELQILTIFGNCGFSHRQIAEVLSISPHTVQQELSSARRRNPRIVDGDIRIPGVTPLTVECELLGLLHPDFLPNIARKYLVSKDKKKKDR